MSTIPDTEESRIVSSFSYHSNPPTDNESSSPPSPPLFPSYQAIDGKTLFELKKAKNLVRQIRWTMRNSWHEDASLIEALFSIKPSMKAKLDSVLQKNMGRKRWTIIPSHPRTVDHLITPLRILLETILIAFGHSYTVSRVLDTRPSSHKQDPKVTGFSSKIIIPHLYLAGIGKNLKNKKKSRYIQNTVTSGVSPIEVSLNLESNPPIRERLAIQMRDILQKQPNRRFAYGLVITPNMCTVYMFDRSGAVSAPPFNYHEHPARFCAVVSGLGMSDIDRVGFDRGMAYEDDSLVITTVESSRGGRKKAVKYRCLQKLFHSSNFFGQYTVVWSAHQDEHPEDRFLIKDSWLPDASLPGREDEGTILQHISDQGITSGVAQMHHFEQIRCGPNNKHTDTILHNRGLSDTPPPHRFPNSVHVRLILKSHGMPIHTFSSWRELLRVFHDAVLAHRNAYETAGVLHRSINLKSILINPGGEEGNRGILVNFEHAIRIDDTSPYSTVHNMQVYRFMSRNALHGGHPHTYFDDLESFYYVLTWILMTYVAPGERSKVIPPSLALWNNETTSLIKHVQLKDPTYYPINYWSKQSGQILHGNLRNFLLKTVPLTRQRDFPLNPDPQAHYDEFLGYIRQAIDKSAREIPYGQSHLGLPSDD